jgi:tetratricopeptide (TPR) repeat protein
VALAPDFPFAHYARGHVLLDMGRLKEAEAAAREAVELDPESPNAFALLSATLGNQSKWRAALEAAENGLAIQADHGPCANLRAQALAILGRGQEARQTLHSALADNPEDSHSLSNLGWVALRQGRHREAAGHFRDALRQDPENDAAREGLLESLRSSFLPYRLILLFFLSLQRFNSQTRWMIVIGLFVGARVLRTVARNNPALQPLITPILVLYTLFVFMTWFARPLMNVFLRVHPIGRHALSPTDREESNWFLGLLGTGVGMTALILTFVGFGSAYAIMGTFIGLFVLAIASLGYDSPHRRTYVRVGGVAAISVCILMASQAFFAEP